MSEPVVNKKAYNSAIIERATRLEQPLRSFITGHYDDEAAELSKEEQAYIDRTTLKIYATILDNWADGEEWEIGIGQATLRDTIWGASATHPTYPLPGPDDNSTALIDFLAETLSWHITKNDVEQLHGESRLAAELLSRWCAAPLI